MTKHSCIALLMAGGEGSRMAATRPGTPKPLVKVAGHPLIDMLLQQIWSLGIQEVHVAVRAGARKILDHLRRLSANTGREIRFIVEEEPLGTIGALAEFRNRSETVLVMNGDLLSAIDLEDLLANHAGTGADLTITTHYEHSRLELGEVRVDESLRVQDYLEKPVKRYRISSGVYVVGPAVLSLFEETSWKPFPDLVHQAIAEGLHIQAFPHDSAWIDVNHEEDLLHAQELYDSDPAAFQLAWRQLLPDSGGRSDS